MFDFTREKYLTQQLIRNGCINRCLIRFSWIYLIVALRPGDDRNTINSPVLGCFISYLIHYQAPHSLKYSDICGSVLKCCSHLCLLCLTCEIHFHKWFHRAWFCPSSWWLAQSGCPDKCAEAHPMQIFMKVGCTYKVGQCRLLAMLRLCAFEPTSTNAWIELMFENYDEWGVKEQCPWV